MARCSPARAAASCIGLLAAALGLAGCGEPPPVEAVAAHWNVLGYCKDCHNNAELAGNLSFEGLKPEDVAQRPATFEKVVRKLRGDLMPPPSEPRPDIDTKWAFVTALERDLDATARERGPEPGNVPLHRINRTEYATAVEDMLGVVINARSMLPTDTSSDGFDNVAEVLRVTPTHIDQYIAAARDISIQAVGNPNAEPARADYRSERGNRTEHVDGLPLGTRGGMLVEHDFPADGVYEINLAVSSIPGSELRGYPYGWLEYQHELVVTIDGARVFSDLIGGEEDSKALDQQQIQAVEAIKNRFRHIRVPVKAGHRKIGAAFVARSFAEGDYLLQSLVPGEGVPDIPRLYGMEILGPYDAAGISGTTKSREHIFICHPSTVEEETPCATKILSNLARQAFRRPVSRDDLAPLMKFYAEGRDEGGFETGVQRGLMAILASTKFLYRAAPAAPPKDLAPGSPYAITDLELAWRLAFFLWSEGPDDTLLKLAADNTLHKPAVLEQQVRRLLADPRSHTLVTNFAFQWLDVRRLDAIDPDPRLYPTFDEDLRNAFRTEMELFVDSILRSDRSVVDLLTASHTFVNERLPTLRPGERAWGPVPPRRAARLETLGPVRQGQRAHGDVVSGPDVACAARCLDSRGDSRDTPDAAPAHGQNQSRARVARRASLGSRAACAASDRVFVQPLPRRDRPARSSAGELRCDRRVAHEGTRQRLAYRLHRHAH